MLYILTKSEILETVLNYMRVRDFLDGSNHDIKLKYWKDNYVRISYSSKGSIEIQFWDNNKFTWNSIVFTLEDVLRNDWEEVKS